MKRRPLAVPGIRKVRLGSGGYFVTSQRYDYYLTLIKLAARVLQKPESLSLSLRLCVCDWLDLAPDAIFDSSRSCLCRQ